MLITMNLIFLIILVGGVVWLQIYLSKRQNKWLGLILPILCFCFSIIAVLGIAAYTSLTVVHTKDIDGTSKQELVEDTIKEPVGDHKSFAITAVCVFLLYNISTTILLAIYVACREKRKKNLELQKMSIQDLE